MIVISSRQLGIIYIYLSMVFLERILLALFSQLKTTCYFFRMEFLYFFPSSFSLLNCAHMMNKRHQATKQGHQHSPDTSPTYSNFVPAGILQHTIALVGHVMVPNDVVLHLKLASL